MPVLFQAPMPITPVEKFVMEKSERNPYAMKADTELRFYQRYYDDLLISSGDTSFINTSEISSSTVKAKRGKSSSSSWAVSSVLTSRTSVRGQWTAEEDNLLVKLVKEHGVRKWSQISKKLVGKIGKQCRERWLNHLRPGIKKDTWTEEEEISLIETHKELGNRWAEISKKIPGRSENSIKNHWNATKRRLSSKRKDRIRKTSNGKTSLLQEYIIKTTELLNNSTSPKQQILPTTQTKASDLNFLNCEHYFNESIEDQIDFIDTSLPQFNELFEGNGSNGEFCSDVYLTHHMDEVPVAPEFVNLHGENLKDFLGDDMDLECKKDMDLMEMILTCSPQEYPYNYFGRNSSDSSFT